MLRLKCLIIVFLFLFPLLCSAINIDQNPDAPEDTGPTIEEQGEYIAQIAALGSKMESIKGDLQNHINENFAMLDSEMKQRISESNAGVVGWVVILVLFNDILVIGFFIYLRMQGLW